MKWMMLFQTPWDSIKFITNEDTNAQYLPYNKFMDFLNTFKINDIGTFKDSINKFQTLLLDCTTGKWEIQHQQIVEGSFEQMLKLNPGVQEIEEQKKKTDPLLKKKNFLDLFSKARKKQVLKK